MVSPAHRDLGARDDGAAGIGHRAFDGGRRGLRGCRRGQQKEQRQDHDDAGDLKPWHHTLSSSRQINAGNAAGLCNIARCTVSTEQQQALHRGDRVC